MNIKNKYFYCPDPTEQDGPYEKRRRNRKEEILDEIDESSEGREE